VRTFLLLMAATMIDAPLGVDHRRGHWQSTGGQIRTADYRDDAPGRVRCADRSSVAATMTKAADVGCWAVWAIGSVWRNVWVPRQLLRDTSLQIADAAASLDCADVIASTRPIKRWSGIAAGRLVSVPTFALKAHPRTGRTPRRRLASMNWKSPPHCVD